MELRSGFDPWAAAGLVLSVVPGGELGLKGLKEAAEGLGRTLNPTKAQSEVWKALDNAGAGRKQSGIDSERRYYEWDHTHNDIEVYNSRKRHLGSMNPVTGEMYKPQVVGRKIK